MSKATTDALRDTERWFVRRGIPHFIADYSATTDIFTRAAPLLTFLFLAEMFGAINFHSWWANTLAVIGAFVLLVGTWGLVNRWRGRPPMQRPTSIGPVELAVFVFVPPLAPAVFGGNLDASLGLITGNVVILVLIYAVTSYGLVPITLWAIGRLFRSLGGTIVLFARALPLLLLFVTFLFINAEVWQVSANLLGPLFGGTLGLFAVFGLVFITVRLPREISGLGKFESWAKIDELSAGTPAEQLASSHTGKPSAVPLDRTQWANVGLMVMLGQAIQVLLVAALVFGFLVILGLLVMPPTVISSWTQMPVQFIGPDFSLLGRQVQFTEELLRVASFLAAFSGLYFAVTVVTDPNYRDEFFEDVVGEVRQAFAVRAVYLDTLNASQQSRQADGVASQ